MQSSQYVLITSAGSDLGKAFAMRFAREGYNLVLIDNEATKLLQLEQEVANLYPSTITVLIPKDLTALTAADELHDELKDEGITVNALINLSPTCEAGIFAETNWADEERLICSGIHTMTHLTKLFVREMLSRNSGKILQVICTSSLLPSSHQAVYGAMQSFLLYFAEALQHELIDKDITLTILSQGKHAGTIPADPILSTGEVRGIEADEIAAIGYLALLQGKKHEVSGKTSEALAMDQLIAESWSAAILNKIREQAAH